VREKYTTVLERENPEKNEVKCLVGRAFNFIHIIFSIRRTRGLQAALAGGSSE
jgi:hypothetical protein